MAVDKIRNMEYSGTFRNIPEHPGTFRNIPKHPGTRKKKLRYKKNNNNKLNKNKEKNEKKCVYLYKMKLHCIRKKIHIRRITE